nr:F-box domain, leucine-rich repeat domain, L domain-like protein [Tanacetum cinerariifolium]
MTRTTRLAQGGKQRGHIAGVGRVLPARATASPSTSAYDSTLNSLHKKVDFMMSIFKSDSKYSDMFSQFESGGASGSGGCGDEEEGVDHQDDEDEDGDGDEITDTKGPVPIQFELRAKQTVMPLGDHAAHWSSYIGEVIRGVPLYYPSWLKVPKERKAALITDIGAAHGIPDWTEINAGIQQHLQKAYNTNKAAFKAQHWVIDPTTGTYNVEKIRREHVARSHGGDGGGEDRPLHTVYPAVAWVALLIETQFDLRPHMESPDWTEINAGIQLYLQKANIARAAQNRQNRAKSTVISRQGSRSLARLRDEMEEMRRLEATGTYTDEEINLFAR